MASGEEIVREIEALLRRLKVINERLSGHLQRNDLRLAAVGLPGNVLHSYLLHGGMAEYTITHKSWWKQAYQRDEPTAGDLAALHNLESMTKHATFVFFLSRHEWTLRKLVTFLFPGACDRGGAAFKSIYDFLLKQLALDHYIPLYDVWRHVRNSVHSNGVFISRSGRDESVVWKGTTYSFYHMKPIDFMDYRRMFPLYHDLIDSIEDILTTQPVSSPTFIEDRVH